MSWLLEHCTNLADRTAIIDQGVSYSYGELAEKITQYQGELEQRIRQGASVAVVSEYQFNSIAVFLALIERQAVIVPIVSRVEEEVSKRIQVAQCECSIRITPTGALRVSGEPYGNEHCLVSELKQKKRAGLILFSSGSTGEPKAMIHDLETLLDSYRDRRLKGLRFLIFLMFDHIGGINTLLNTMAMGAVAVLPQSRDPNEIGELIERYAINVLPSSPTFLNLLLINGVIDSYNFAKLKMITYGTEPMPAHLLKRLRTKLPRVRFLQTFGTSETGIAQTASRSSDSLELKIADANTEYKIVNGELYLKSKTQVLGYLNADMESFTEDGWFKTGDLVEELPGGYIKILGRNKEVINVGGEKVLPSEVESVLLELEEVLDVTVSGKPNAITGQTVISEVVILGDQDASMIKKKIRSHCRERLSAFKVPTKIKIVSEPKFTDRFKKNRLDKNPPKTLQAV